METLKEIRYWIILVIVLIVFGGLGYNLHNSNKKEIGGLSAKIKNQEELTRQKDKLIRALEERLLAKPEVEIRYKTKEKIVYKNPPKELVNLFDSYCAGCTKLDIRPEIKIETSGIICLANICDPSDAACEFKKDVIDDVTVDIINDLNKKNKIFKLKVLTGYEFVNSGLLAGISFIDYKGILLGADVVINTNDLESNSGLGLFLGYQPEFKKWSINMIFSVGILSKFSNFNDVGVQTAISFPLIERQ